MTNWTLIKNALQQLAAAVENAAITDRQIENGVTKVSAALSASGFGFKTVRQFQAWSIAHESTGDKTVYGPLTRAEARAWLAETNAHVERLPEANK